jgi:hypothetical protein
MTVDDLNETVSALRVALTALQAAVPGQAGRAGASFRYACGDTLAQAPTLLQAAAIGTPLRSCFDDAVAAGATLNGLAALRRAMWALSYVSGSAMAVGGACCCLALGAEASILADATFASSTDALAALAVFQAAVSVAQDWALDNHLSAQYQALIGLGAAVARDLQSRAAPLPRLTTYSFPRGTSSLVLAYRLYGDANRADELRAENGTIHPAFMPSTGSALSE